MQLRNFLPTMLVLGLAFVGACDDGDDATDAADAGDGDGDGETGDGDTETGSSDATCSTFCEAYITQCLQTGMGTEFETNDLCLAACTWDQAGINCRYEQIPDSCDQAGNMGTACP